MVNMLWSAVPYGRPAGPWHGPPQHYNVLCHETWTNMAAQGRRHFRIHLFEKKYMNPDDFFIEINWLLFHVIISACNGLALHKYRFAIAWNDDNGLLMHVYVNETGKG